MFGSKSIPVRRLVPQGLEERHVPVKGHRIRYLYGGRGPAVLLIHGLLGFSFSWSENLAELAKNFTVYAPDLINAGYSDRADLPADLRSAAMQVRDFMDATGIARAEIIGSSYGGTVAMELAVISPGRVCRLILAAPAHCGSEHGRWQVTVFSTTIGQLASHLVRFTPAFVHGLFIRGMYGDFRRALPGTVRGYARAIRIPGTTVAAAKVMKCWKANFDGLCDEMPALASVEALLIWGDRDSIVPLKTSQSLMQEMPRAKLAVIPGAGHLPYEEFPAEFNRIVCDYLLDGQETGDANVVSVPRKL